MLRFGYDSAMRAAGIPIPMYQIGNVLTLGTLGKHHYNDSAFGAVKNLLGLSEEQNGLIYTRRGGFIDIAHVRDTADNTFICSIVLRRRWVRRGGSSTVKNWACAACS